MPTSIAIVLCAALSAGADDPPKPVDPPAAATAPAAAPAGPSFRLAFQHFDVGKRPIGRGEVIASRGRFYYLEKNSNEVIVIEPARKAIHLVDLKLGLAADLTYREVDAGLAVNRDEQRKVVEAHSKSKSRNDRIDAEIRRDLSDPRFRVTFDEAAHALRMSDPSAQVEARGEPEDDPARLAALAEALGTLAKLGAYRDPDNLKLLVEVEAVSALVEGRKLRPAEMTYLFRLAGPPEKYRWTFLLIPEVSDEDRQWPRYHRGAAGQVAACQLFDRFDRRLDPDALK